MSCGVQGWNSTHPAFAEVIAEVRPKTIIEIGSWKGASAIHMASLCDAQFYCVDTFLGSFEHYRDGWIKFGEGMPNLYPQFMDNVEKAGVASRVVAVPLPSNIAAKVLAHRKVVADLIYVDGSHEAEDVRADLRNFWPLLRVGGVMFGDDWDWRSVQDEVRAFGSPRIHDGKFWSFIKSL